MFRYVLYSLMIIVCFDEATAKKECARSLVSETDKSHTINTLWDAVAIFQINEKMTDCDIDVMKIFIDFTKRLNKNEISMRLQLTCMTASKIHFINESDVLENFNGKVTVDLNINNCLVDLDELSLFNHLGRIYALSLFNISSISVGSICSILKGLQRLDFSFNCASTSTNNFKEKLFFWEKCKGSFDSLSVLELTGCKIYNVDYLTLNTKFPSIRSIKLSSIKLQTSLKFPWTSLQTENDMDYPLMKYNAGTWSFSLNDIDIFPKIFVTFKGRIDAIVINNVPVSIFERDIFWNVKGMTRLDLSQNKLTHIQPDLLRCQTSLKYLRLSGNKLKHLDSVTFQFLRNLTYLDLSHNLLTVIDGNLFSNLHVLGEIHLEHNFINSIPKDFLQEQTSTIEKVFLQFNNIKTIPVFPLYARHLQLIDLNHCSVDGNSFTTLINHLKLLYLSDSYSDVALEYTNIHLDEYEHLSTRAVLDLSYCHITDISIAGINGSGLVALIVLFNVIELNLSGNPFDCSCSQWNPIINISWTCLYPPDLRGRPIKSISLEEKRCPSPSTECPPNCKCYKRLSSENVIVDCNNKNVTTFPLKVPNGYLELWFQNSNITNITSREYFKNILALDISNNNVHELSPSVILSFPKNIKSVLLNDNHLTSLPVQLKSLNVSKLALSHNPFICDCHTKWMKEWLLDMTTPVTDWKQVKCTYNLSKAKQLISVPSYMFVCPELNSSKFNVAEHVIFPAIVIGCIMFVLVTVSLTVYFQRFTVKVLLYMYTGLRPFDNLPGDESSFLYDAFVIYTERKRQVAHEKLLDSLTVRGYRVADLSRGFIIGLSLVDNIERLIHNSKRIIFFVSGDFTEDDLIMAGWNIAYQRAVSGDFNSIILIASGDFRKQCKEDNFRKFLRSKGFIKENSKLLVDKVVYLMPKLHDDPYMEMDNTHGVFQDHGNGINYILYPTEDDVLSKEVTDKLIPFLRKNHQNIEYFENAFVAGTDIRDEMDDVLEKCQHFIFILAPEMFKEERYEVALFILSTVISKAKLSGNNYLLLITKGELRSLDMPGDLRSYFDKYKTCDYQEPTLKQYLLDSLVYQKPINRLDENNGNAFGRKADTRIPFV